MWLLTIVGEGEGEVVHSFGVAPRGDRPAIMAAVANCYPLPIRIEPKIFKILKENYDTLQTPRTPSQ